ncbi:Mitochondrial fission protein [Nowakowskiella sp. JEL0407]|nr:Mitochondrial fission protein [Nowakowskiella sp. JEL0407]
MDYSLPDPEKEWRDVEADKQWSMRESFIRIEPEIEEEYDISENNFEEETVSPIEILPPPPPPNDFFTSPPISPTNLASAATTTWKSLQSFKLPSFTNNITTDFGSFLKSPSENAQPNLTTERTLNEQASQAPQIAEIPPPEIEPVEYRPPSRVSSSRRNTKIELPKELQSFGAWLDPKDELKEEPLVVPGLEDAVSALSNSYFQTSTSAIDGLGSGGWDEEDEGVSEQTTTLSRYADYLEDLGVPKEQIPVKPKTTEAPNIEKSKSLPENSISSSSSQVTLVEDSGPVEEFPTDSTITFYQGFRAVYPNLSLKRNIQQQTEQTRSLMKTSLLNPLLNFYQRGGFQQKNSRSSPTLGLRNFNSRRSIEYKKSETEESDGTVVLRTAAAAAAAAEASDIQFAQEKYRPLPDTARTQAVSITNIARLFSELLNQRDALLEGKEELEDTKKTIVNELNQLEELLKKLTARKADLTTKLKDVNEREESMDAVLKDLEARLASISEETISAEKRIRSIKADTAILDFTNTPEIPPDTCIRTLSGHEDSIECLDFDIPYGTLATGSADKSVRIWDLSSHRCHAQLVGHTGWIKTIQIHRNMVLSGSNDNTIRQWDVSRLPPLPTISNDMAPSIPYCIFDATVDEEDSDNVCVRVFKGHTGGISSLQFDERWLISGSVDKTIRQWDMVTGQQIALLKADQWKDTEDKIDMFLLGEYRDPVSFALGMSAITENAAAAEALSSQNVVQEFEGKVPSTESKEGTDSDGSDLEIVEKSSASEVENTKADADVISTATMQPVVNKPAPVSSPSFKVDNGGQIGALQFWQHALAAGYADGVIRLWDLRSGKCHRQFKSTNGHYQAITALKFDSLAIATGSLDKTVKIWDIRTGDVGDVIRFDHSVNDIHMDLTRIGVATGAKEVKIYNRTTSSVRNLVGHTRGLRALRCVDDTLISAGMDNTAKVWRVK